MEKDCHRARGGMPAGNDEIQEAEVARAAGRESALTPFEKLFVLLQGSYRHFLSKGSLAW
jgi:hypothetical protein